MRDPDTSPNTIDILEPDLGQATALAEKLADLPEVSRARTIESFVPKDQDEKLALIDDASFFFQNTMTPDELKPAATPAETLEAINKTAADLSDLAAGIDTPAAAQARRLAGVMTELAKGAACSAARGRAPPRNAASDDAPAGARSFERRAGNARLSAARAQERVGRARRRGEDRGCAKRRRQQQRGPAPLRRGSPRRRAAGDRDADLRRRGRGDHRQSFPSGGRRGRSFPSRSFCSSCCAAGRMSR